MAEHLNIVTVLEKAISPAERRPALRNANRGLKASSYWQPVQEMTNCFSYTVINLSEPAALEVASVLKKMV
ncbi:hypothetical protein [Burkholderia ambifaria]|uniref:hypothetical protein n=1 Tax=Burkholderia ambifaria TaxID=152480 RepID=UPI00158B9FF3|nr:hypothetical protein [Burkholderia ambifaria]